MKLDVPIIIQDKDSVDCGIAGIAMILKYHGIDADYNQLKSEISTTQTGTYMPQLGSFLIKEGFDVSIITMHPRLFTLDDENASQQHVLGRLSSLNAQDSKQEKAIVYFKKFIEDGGRIIVKVPDIKDIQSELDGRRPVCALMTSNFLSAHKPVFNFHFNIITGYDTEYIYANDPLWDERGGSKKYRITDFLYGLYASAYGDIDNASLMCIKKR